jgi:hypothetical protein
MRLAEHEGAPQAVIHQPGQEAGGMPGEPSGGSQTHPVIQRRVPPPQPGGGEERQRGHRVAAGELERDPAAERVARDMGSGDAEITEEARDGRRQRGRPRLHPRRQRPGVAEAGQVDGDDVEALGESGKDGIPGVAG